MVGRVWGEIRGCGEWGVWSHSGGVVGRCVWVRVKWGAVGCPSHATSPCGAPSDSCSCKFFSPSLINLTFSFEVLWVVGSNHPPSHPSPNKVPPRTGYWLPKFPFPPISSLTSEKSCVSSHCQQYFVPFFFPLQLPRFEFQLPRCWGRPSPTWYFAPPGR